MTSMKHGPRRRVRRTDAIGLAVNGAQLLADQERARILQPLQTAFTNMRQGIGSDYDWAQLASAMNVAQAIEHQGVVHGLAGHLHRAELTLQTMHRRAEEDAGSRYPYAMHLAEIETLHTAVDLYAFQLSKLSRTEYRRACQYAFAEVLSTGGVAIEAPAPQQQALALGAPA
jgi:hypothetical protein